MFVHIVLWSLGIAFAANNKFVYEQSSMMQLSREPQVHSGCMIVSTKFVCWAMHHTHTIWPATLTTEKHIPWNLRGAEHSQHLYYRFLNTDAITPQYVYIYIYGPGSSILFLCISYIKNIRLWVQIWMRIWIRSTILLHDALFGNIVRDLSICSFFGHCNLRSLANWYCVFTVVRSLCICLEQPDRWETRSHAQRRRIFGLGSIPDPIGDQSDVWSYELCHPTYLFHAFTNLGS